MIWIYIYVNKSYESLFLFSSKWIQEIMICVTLPTVSKNIIRTRRSDWICTHCSRNHVSSTSTGVRRALRNVTSNYLTSDALRWIVTSSLSCSAKGPSRWGRNPLWSGNSSGNFWFVPPEIKRAIDDLASSMTINHRSDVGGEDKDTCLFLWKKVHRDTAQQAMISREQFGHHISSTWLERHCGFCVMICARGAEHVTSCKDKRTNSDCTQDVVPFAATVLEHRGFVVSKDQVT